MKIDRTCPQVKDLCLVPKPSSWTPSVGHLDVQSVNQNPPLWYSVDALAVRCNLPPLQDDRRVLTNLEKDDMIPADGYRIEITPEWLDVRSGAQKGAHYAGITLLVLREINDGNIPCGVMEDHPRFEWRGQHLDCARHFYKVDSINKLIDVIELLKINRVQWHFSDDEAFCLELQSVLELANKTRLGGENQLIPSVFGDVPMVGGVYSKENVKSIIDYKKSVFIEVSPEIECPAHALAVTRVLPETRDAIDIGTVASVQVYSENVLKPVIPETWQIIESISQEVSTLFPLGMLLLGADELPEMT